MRNADDVARAETNVRALGWEPVTGAHVLERERYLAGSDAARLEDLNRALRDPAIDGVWCIRGGYGVMRLLDRIDYDALRASPKTILGYSDITALHCAVGQRCNLITYHGPTAREVLTPFSRNSLERAIVFGTNSCGTAHGARTIKSGIARGRLVGGNLALVSALCGTPYAPNFRDAILVLEDVNEPVYRVDRMLQQILMSGGGDGIAGIAFGQCTYDDADTATGDDTAAFDALLREVADALNIPCVAGLPIGHIPEQWTIPLGGSATLDADGLALEVDGIPSL